MLTSNPSPNPCSEAQASVHSNALLRQTLRRAYEECRQSTLDLVKHVNSDRLCRQAHPDFSPVGWHIGHIAYTEAQWILERFAGHPPSFPEYRRLFAADGLPKAERQHLPDIQTLYRYLDCVRQSVFDYLDTAPVDRQERIWQFLLQHESQHCETMTLILELFRIAEINNPQHDQQNVESRQSISVPSQAAPMCFVPAGNFQMGHNANDALDNECPTHVIYLEDFWIDRHPVTCREFQAFIDAGGYTHQQWWSAEGWAWRQTHRISHPLYWRDRSSRPNHPVCGVSWYEATAYAQFVGKRLPTEAEWEKAARWNPTTKMSQLYPWGNTFPTKPLSNYGHHVAATTDVKCYSNGASPVGCVDLLGNVWEWTSSIFKGYEGFQAFPYVGYSQAYFDDQHYVLRGGSWATRPWALRPSLRNWYHPWTRQIIAGFRCASSISPSH